MVCVCDHECEIYVCDIVMTVCVWYCMLSCHITGVVGVGGWVQMEVERSCECQVFGMARDWTGELSGVRILSTALVVSVCLVPMWC